jgi:hypothetical protein
METERRRDGETERHRGRPRGLRKGEEEEGRKRDERGEAYLNIKTLQLVSGHNISV